MRRVDALASIRQITDLSLDPPVSGFLHTPGEANGDGVVLTHGAGADCRSRLLTATARALADAGFTVLRCDLPFRQQRPHGPPSPATSPRDREGLGRAIELLRKEVRGRIFLGGHSYGGRQSTILASEEQMLVAGLLLLSYPLHPPKKPLELRTAHFPRLTTPALFVHGSRDPFGSLEEMRAALKLTAAPSRLLEIEGQGHELLPRNDAGGVPERIVAALGEFFRSMMKPMQR